MKKDINKEEEKLRKALKGNDSFIVPPAYFEELSGKIMDQINTLPDFSKNAQINPFTVPDGYFENLPAIVGFAEALNIVLHEKEKEVKKLAAMQEFIFNNLPEHVFVNGSLESEKRIELIEIYHQEDKENEDRERIYKYYNS